MISILHLFNLNDLVISVILISKIEETNILIENPKTQNKNESNLNPFNNKNKNNISYPNLKNGKKKYQSQFRRWRMYGLTVSFCVLAISAV